MDFSIGTKNENVGQVMQQLIVAETQFLHILRLLHECEIRDILVSRKVITGPGSVLSGLAGTVMCRTGLIAVISF